MWACVSGLSAVHRLVHTHLVSVVFLEQCATPTELTVNDGCGFRSRKKIGETSTQKTFTRVWGTVNFVLFFFRGL